MKASLESHALTRRLRSSILFPISGPIGRNVRTRTMLTGPRSLSRFSQTRVVLAGAAFLIGATLAGSSAFAASCGGVSTSQNTGVHSASAGSGIHTGISSGSTHGGSSMSSCPTSTTVSGTQRYGERPREQPGVVSCRPQFACRQDFHASGIFEIRRRPLVDQASLILRQRPVRGAPSRARQIVPIVRSPFGFH